MGKGCSQESAFMDFLICLNLLLKNSSIVLLAFAALSLISVEATSITQGPESRNVTISTGYVTMTCKASAQELYYTVNDTFASFSYLASLGIYESHMIYDAPGVLTRNLTIKVSELTNNSRIVCVSYNLSADFIVTFNTSEEAVLLVQGRLMKPKNLEVETNREEFNISWTAPLTMENTVIDGYNVSVNGEYYIFTKDTEVSIPFNSSNSPCIQVEISAFNGLDGDSAQIKVHIPSNQKLIVKGTVHDIDNPVNIAVSLTVYNVSGLCEEKKPHTIRTTIYNINDNNTSDLPENTFSHSLVSDGNENHTLRSNDSIRLDGTQQYRIANTLLDSYGNFINHVKSDLYVCRDDHTHRIFNDSQACHIESQEDPTSTGIRVVPSVYFMVLPIFVFGGLIRLQLLSF